MLAEYRYGLFEVFYLPDILFVRVPSYFLSATIKEDDYKLNIPIPDEVFIKK